MFKSIKFRAALVVLIFLGALFYLTPTVVPELPEFWTQNLPKDKIHLGLDLQGGMHLVLEVEADKSVDATMERMSNNLKETLMENKVRFRNIDRTPDKMITLELTDPTARETFEKTLKNHYPDLEIASSEMVEGREKIYLRMNKDRAAEVKKLAVEQSLETIRNRVDQFGISEPEIIPQGEDRILIQLPGIKDAKRAKNLIGKTALLEFKLVDEENSLEEALKGNVPEGDQVAYGLHQDPETGRQATVPYLLKSKTLLTGDSLESAKVQISDRFGEPHVAIKFNAQGAEDFDRITGDNVKKRLAIVLDGSVYSAPVIQERISGGQAQITGAFTMEEARDLAIVLRAGALPAPVNILEERTVGPSLGQDSINKGTWSCIVAGILIFHIHGLLLPGLRLDRRSRPGHEPHSTIGRHGHVRRDPDPPRYCRYRPDHRYGRRRKRPHFRAHPGGTAHGEDAAGSDRCGLHQGFSDHFRLERNDPGRGALSVRLRNRTGKGICRHADHRYRGQHVYGGLRHTHYLRLFHLEP